MFWANEMNRLWSLEKELQFEFYYKGIPKGKRFSKWEKKLEEDDLVTLLCQVYTINKMKAADMLKVLTEEQIEIIKTKYRKGGKR